ncbi:hypothetical protein O3P69_005927 [Scylla paramamosain]|uniref:Large ribosomal subunit protein mL45 n=1 Tax=Scylla paramamosain TaxID=85552 RepID=A0AAW0U7P5_SCYPA
MTTARLTVRLSQLSLHALPSIRSSSVPLPLLAPASIPTQAQLTWVSYVHRDPNYKHFAPNFGFKRKHYIEKFKKDRKQKFIKVNLPDPNEKDDYDSMTPEEIRAKMKEKGIKPVRPWQERPVCISSTTSTFEPYVPPEGDGKVSTLSTAGAKQKIERLEKKGKSMMAVRKIRQFDDDFDPKLFAADAQEIYIASHRALADGDMNKLHQCVTERAFPLVTHESRHKTIRWQFLGSLEPPRAVHIRCTDVISKENIFAQVTVRFHTKQTLAVYDRFGRLLHGSEVVARDVLEYVVFEKHMANTYGLWRVHDKIIPDWMPPKQPVRRTYRVKEMEEEEEEATPSKEETSEVADSQNEKPAVAVA